MATTVTLADIFRPYVKPSLDGRLVLRKRTSRQVSERLKSWQRELIKVEKKPAERAHEKCVQEGKAIPKRVYIPRKGYETKAVCPIQEFRKYLREAMIDIASATGHAAKE